MSVPELQKISGRVRCASRALPVEGVTIIGNSSDGTVDFEIQTESDGKWSASISGNLVSLTVRHADFIEKTVAPEVAEIRLLEDQIAGYLDQLWSHPGDKMAVRVHAPRRYHATVFRHGLAKEVVAALGAFEPMAQQVPDTVFNEQGPDWQAAFDLPTPEEPGLYSILLEDERDRTALPFIVSATATRHELLVLPCVGTWQCYNLWGGRSRYRSNEDSAGGVSLKSGRVSIRHRFEEFAARILPSWIKVILKRLLGRQTLSDDWKYKRLTVRRPMSCSGLCDDNVMAPFTNHLAASDWRLLAWLEREGIGYDVAADIELDRAPELLDGRRAVILSSHSEYWSPAMYNAVHRFHTERLGWLVNLSGNTMFGCIEVFDDGSQRYIGPLRETVADESLLTGGRVTNEDYATCAPYRVMADGHWALDGVPAEEGMIGCLGLNRETPRTDQLYDPARPAVASGLSGQGASGWETDKRTAATPSDMTMLAKGVNPKGGAEMMVREPEGSRGGMFSAGSITFVGSLLVDPGTSKLTRNVIERALDG
jgi:N,N-dimethylformamidase